MEELKRQYRCTLPDRYGLGTPGHTNPRARNGHYVSAYSREDARAKVARSYPNDRIDVEPWS